MYMKMKKMKMSNLLTVYAIFITRWDVGNECRIAVNSFSFPTVRFDYTGPFSAKR